MAGRRKPKNDEVPGSAYASQMQYERNMVKHGEALGIMEHVFDRLSEGFLEVKGLKIRLPRFEGDEYMVVVTAYGEEGDVVAFHMADTFAEAVVGMCRRLKNGSVKWKVDQYAPTNQGDKDT